MEEENNTELTAAQLKTLATQVAIHKIFILPFLRVWHGGKMLLTGLLGILMMPFVLALGLGSMALTFVRHGWRIWAPITIGAVLAYFLPYSDYVNVAIGTAWAVATFLLLTLFAAIQGPDDE